MDEKDKALLLIELINNYNSAEQFNLLLLTILFASPDPTSGIFLWENQIHIRLDGFNELWINRYLEYDFFRLFRMTKATFAKLWEQIDGPEFHYHYHGGTGPSVQGHIQLLMTLWWLGKGEVLLSVAEKFSIVPSTVYNCTNLILNKLLELVPKYIYWPKTTEEFEMIVGGFQERSGYPGVVGAIDGTNIKFKAPLLHQDSYIDKNDCHSIKLQAICTSQKIFINIMAGFPGSAHDSRVFRNSKIYLDIAEGQRRRYFPRDEYHLVGDKAYPLMNWLMKPYLGDDRHLTRQQRAHNLAHSRTRIVVEHAFGLLKGRWRILQYINVKSVTKAVQVIVACCLLHNFCYFHGDNFDEENLENEDNNPDDDDNGGVRNEAGIRKRDLISELF